MYFFICCFVFVFSHYQDIPNSVHTHPKQPRETSTGDRIINDKSCIKSNDKTRRGEIFNFRSIKAVWNGNTASEQTKQTHSGFNDMGIEGAHSTVKRKIAQKKRLGLKNLRKEESFKRHFYLNGKLKSLNSKPEIISNHYVENCRNVLNKITNLVSPVFDVSPWKHGLLYFDNVSSEDFKEFEFPSQNKSKFNWKRCIDSNPKILSSDKFQIKDYLRKKIKQQYIDSDIDPLSPKYKLRVSLSLITHLSQRYSKYSIKTIKNQCIDDEFYNAIYTKYDIYFVDLKCVCFQL